MQMLLPEPVTLTANIPGRMEISQVPVNPPKGLSQSSVGAFCWSRHFPGGQRQLVGGGEHQRQR